MMPAEIHPGPSAGDGRLEPRRTTYKNGDRVIELRRCAQCGFINRDGIEVTGDSTDSPGISQVLTNVANTRGSKNLPTPLVGVVAIANRNGFNFTASSMNYTIPSQVSGCRFCGSLNSKGINRNWRDYGTGIDLSNK